MDQNVILAKTEKGSSEISTRQYKLNPRLRAILIVVDGKTTFGSLLSKFNQIDNVENDINALIGQRFIKAIADFKKQRMAISRTLTDLLGPNADHLTMQIEDCKAVDELVNLINEKRQMLKSSLGARGTIFWMMVKEVTG
jgi:hypothetical protein